MSGEKVCITNTMHDWRSCTIRGEHFAHCDGFARRWNAQTNRVDILDSECRGCLPRPAEVGYLCYDHVVKLDAALREVDELVAFMIEDASNGVRDANSGGGTASSGPRWPLSEARIRSQWIAAALRNAVDVLNGRDQDEWWTITCSDGTRRRFLAREARAIDLTELDRARLIPLEATPEEAAAIVRDLADWLAVDRDKLAAIPFGAEAAVRAVAVIQAGYATFPLVEAEHRIVGIRCPNCQQPQLVWTPPLMQRGDVVIRCGACGHREPQSWLEQYAAIMQLRPARVSA